MAILLLTGTPGAGKSYSAVALTIVPALNLGRPIRTNIPLVYDEISQVWPDADIREFEIHETVYNEFPGGALIVLDEANSCFPSGQRADRANPHAFEWLKMHRHRIGMVGERQLSQEVVLISQGSSDLAKWVRTKIDKTYVIRKLDAVGAEKRFRCDIYQGCQDTDRPAVRSHIRGYTGTYEDKYTGLYHSHTQGQSFDGVNVEELRADKTATIWNRPMVKAALLGPFVAIAASWYAVTHVNDFLGVDKAEPEPVKVSAVAEPAEPQADTPTAPVIAKTPAPAPAQSPASVPAPASMPAPVPVPPQSTNEGDWRLVAHLEYLTGPNAGKHAVTLSKGRDRRSLRDVICETRYGNETWCYVDDRWVSSFTGNRPDLWEVVNPPAPDGSIPIRPMPPDAGIPPGVSVVRADL
ncbi:zonular occludens toxin domain-containing protein [Thiocystis violacea]|uniref:zonular occludens toxin domain-containing protein n=1 Tax=Thiocystis violacea TaxID=13725 RepID=UPI001907BC60|nr:zonular occludens toxin domain-containing protein [Thiocystis violacea]MBK1718524.1 hypothetical protein [Thiocystis violacea]